MRLASFVLAAALPATAIAQATQQSAAPALDEAHIYSIWTVRHAAIAKLADVAVARATNGDVRKVAERLATEEREASDRLKKDADKNSVAIVAVAHDTTDALVAGAIAALAGKSGRDFDAEWVARTKALMTTIILDNNINVSGKLPDGELKNFSRAYSTFQFRLSTDVASLEKKLK